MQMHMIQTGTIIDPPDGIRILGDWGRIQIITDNGDSVVGRHIAIDGDRDVVMKWLAGEKVWVGKGSPIFQQFELIEFLGEKK